MTLPARPAPPDSVFEEFVAILREEYRAALAEAPKGRRVQLTAELEVEAGKGCVPGRCRVARPWRVARGERYPTAAGGERT